MATTLVVRGVTFPVMVAQMKNTARMSVRPRPWILHCCSPACPPTTQCSPGERRVIILASSLPLSAPPKGLSQRSSPLFPPPAVPEAPPWGPACAASHYIGIQPMPLRWTLCLTLNPVPVQAARPEMEALVAWFKEEQMVRSQSPET